jgi:hypothetical protein
MYLRHGQIGDVHGAELDDALIRGLVVGDSRKVECSHDRVLYWSRHEGNKLDVAKRRNGDIRV